MSLKASSNWPNVLRDWASLGAELLASRSRDIPDWRPVDRMIKAARQKLAGDAKRLKQLLNESRKQLFPLNEDPFDVDLGLHRWLDADREEAYSDWLAWVVCQADPARVFSLFGLTNPPPGLVECRRIEIQRECCIAHGHEGQAGRLDLVIRFGEQAIIVVEVKKGDADRSDTTKHAGYSRWLTAQNCRVKHQVLVAVTAEQSTYEGFDFVPWASLCREMRCLSVGHCRQGRVITAAMILAFVAAVEQNLLGYSARLVKEICADRVVSFNPAIVDHLERCVEQAEA